MIEAAVIALALAADPPVEKQAEPWKRHTIDDSSRGADGVRIADANGDGLMDIATGWEEGGIVRVYLNPGHDKSKDKWPAVTVGQAKNVEDAVFVDLDNDGALDVVSSCEGKTRTMFVHWAPKDPTKYLDDKSWTTEPIPATVGKQMWMYALPMQVDGKRGIDLVIGSKGKGAAVGWLESPENPRELDGWNYHKIVDAGWIMSIQRKRVSYRTPTPILVSDRKGPDKGIYELFRSKAKPWDGKWEHKYIYQGTYEVMFMGQARNTKGSIPAAGLWCATRNGRILRCTQRTMAVNSSGNRALGRDKMFEWSHKSIPNPFDIAHGKGVAVGDIDGDKKLDLVHTANTGGDRSKPGVAWISDIGGDRVSHNISGPRGVKFDRIELIDLDGDGDLDVITCEERDNLGVIWYENPTK